MPAVLAHSHFPVSELSLAGGLLLAEDEPQATSADNQEQPAEAVEAALVLGAGDGASLDDLERYVFASAFCTSCHDGVSSVILLFS